MAAGGWRDWAEGELVTEALFQDIQDSVAFIYASESAANTALTNKVEGTQFYDTGADQLKIWDGSAWVALGGGITMADAWRLNSNFTFDIPNGIVDTNWERVDSYSYGTIGSAMTESSGIFTFPETGIYKIDLQYSVFTGGSIVSFFLNIQTTTDNSTYNNASGQLNFVSGTANMYAGGYFSFIMDVTNTTTHKFRISNGVITGTAPALRGNTNTTETGLFFTRLGDT